MTRKSDALMDGGGHISKVSQQDYSWPSESAADLLFQPAVPMLALTFTVSRPLSVNAAYGRQRAGMRKGDRFLRAAGRAFKDRVRSAAIVARSGMDWPHNLWRVRRAELSYQLYDYRGDSDGPRKLARDALEGILYVNDRLVQDGPAPLPIRDGGGARMVVTVTILEMIDGPTAARMREKVIAARVARELRKRG